MRRDPEVARRTMEATLVRLLARAAAGNRAAM